MTCWLLDDGPLGRLAMSYDESWAWPAGTLHVVEEVAAGCRRDQSQRRQKLLDLQGREGPVIEVHSIPVGSAASEMLYQHLRPRASSAVVDLGEHASIAYAAMLNPSAVFVTQDKTAAYLALLELGPKRVATPFDLWSWLRDEALIEERHYNHLVEGTCKHLQLPVPHRFKRERAG
jgi:hypothetical protein